MKKYYQNDEEVNRNEFNQKLKFLINTPQPKSISNRTNKKKK